MRKVRRILVTLVVSPIAAVLWILRIRFLWVTNPDRIGHLVAEPDAYLKQKRLGQLPAHFGILVIPADKVANRALLTLWQSLIPSISDPKVVRLVFVLWRFRFLWLDFDQYIVPREGRPGTYYQILQHWGNRPPVLRLSAEIAARGDDAMERLGVPKGAWFACIHVREAGFSQWDDRLHDYRNCNISNYLGAVDEVVRRGGWCIRMGDTTATPLQSHPRFIDYAHSAERSDWMDLYLSSRCRIFLGTTSGLILTAMAFGPPCIMSNFVPISCIQHTTSGFCMPKLLRERSSGRFLTFKELAESEYLVSYSGMDAIPGIEIVENSSDELLEAVRELLDELEGQDVFCGDAPDLARRFLSIYPDGHFASYAQSRVSPSFLRKYRDLLPPA